MQAAQVAWAIFSGLFVVASVVLFCFEAVIPAWVLLVVGVLGWVMLSAMILTDKGKPDGPEATP